MTTTSAPPNLPPPNGPWRVPHPWTPPSPPPESLATRRYLMRMCTPADAEAMLAAIDVDRASLLPWVAWARNDNRNVAECIYNIERFRRFREDPSANDFSFGIFDKETGELLGGAGIIRIDRELHQGEIGYWVRADRRRQGIATETTAAIISWGFLPQDRGGWGLRRMVLFIVAQNTASKSVPTKLGLRLELTGRANQWLPGEGYVDMLSWGVNSDEWDIDNHRMLAR